MDFLKVFGRGKRQVPELAVRISCFREVLQANNSALGFLARIQEALEGSSPLAAAEVRRMVAGVTVQTYRMIANLNRMTGEKFTEVTKRFDGIKTRLARTVELTPTLQSVGFTVPLDELGPHLAEVVGQKSAYLGEARRILGGNVPPGFATAVDSYRAFMETEGLADRIAEVMQTLDPSDMAGCFQASAQVVQMVENARVPDNVRQAVEASVRAVAEGGTTRFAVRSSALQEGGVEMSFAGQYRSLLNIPPEGVMDAFRRVVASKYSPQAITYRLGRGYVDQEVAMCCCVIAMVDAATAGVLYTSFPTESGRKTLVQAVRGLGLSAVDGSAEPDTFTLDRARRRVIEVKRGVQTTLLRSAAQEGTEKATVGAEAQDQPVVTEAQALQIADLAWRLESALGMPIDVEWAVDRQGQVFILQVRPLSDVSSRNEEPRKKRLATAPVLVDRGTRASGGAAAGPVFHVETDLDILCCPAGAVLVTHEANPRFAVLLPRVAAIVADMGEVTGHLATVARELRVPALFATRRATEILQDAAVVTVDADAQVVYEGRIEEALTPVSSPDPGRPRDPNRDLLESVTPLIIPLTLRDRLASGYSPRHCKTLHDIIRFCHQATIEAMFDLGDSALRKGQPLRRLVSPVPIDCRVFDLGGGVDPNVDTPEVAMEAITCRPMRELWRGMIDPRLRWRQQRPVSVRGFMSALVNYNFDDDARMRRMGEPSFAFISAEYLNLNSRIGYHFSTIDARVCDMVESNYASFRFVGGSTGVDQRSRRATLIQRLLAAKGFETDARADLVNSRIRHRSPEEMDQSLFLVGLVMGYVNHLDMALVSDGVMAVYEREFLAGNYGFKGDDGPSQGTPID
jgi:pyruvate,water dikinase